jgi:hypothetical protein
MGIRSFPELKSGRGVTLTPHRLLVPWSRKGRAIPLFSLWAVRPVQSLSACTRVHFTFYFSLVFCRPIASGVQVGVMHPLQIWPHPLRIGRITKTNIANHEANPRKKIAVAIDGEGEHRKVDTQCMHTLRLQYRAIAWLNVGLFCPDKGAFYAYGYILYLYIRSRCITEHYIRR